MFAAELFVEAESSGCRIDTFLERHFRNYTSWRLQRIVRGGGVTINFAVAEQTDRVFYGQRVHVTLLEPPDKLLRTAPLELSVVYEDDWLLVVDKPAGMIAHPAGEHPNGSLANAVQHHLDAKVGLKGIARPGIVHRIDRQTSGLMAIALNYTAHRNLAATFEASRVAKTYVALVEGVIRKDAGVIDAPIGRTPTGRQVLMTCRADGLDRRPSKTHFKVIERFDRHTFVVARPVTGRNHQIRVHFAHIGHPLIGDEFYEAHGVIKPLVLPDPDADPDEHDAGVETGLPIRRHALHAARLEFAHPITGAWMEFSAPLPLDFRETIDELRREEMSQPAELRTACT
jgi:23S rRNA pseudouridine1911/1915/1917 synthase